MGESRLATVSRAGQVDVHAGGDVARPGIEGRWPSWRPGANQFALSSLRPEGDAIASTVDLFDAGTGQQLRELHRVAPGASPFIAPRVPHYACWAPTGERLAIVAPTSSALALFIADANLPAGGEPVASGGPIFSAWSPHGERLAVHSGATLTVVDAIEGGPGRLISETAAAFRTPAWDLAGEHVIYVMPGEPGMNLMRCTADGASSEVLARLSGGMAFAFRHGSSELTVAITTRPDSGVFDELYALDTAGSSPHLMRVLGGPVLAFWWSPEGDRLAVVRPHHTGDGLWSIQAYDDRYRFLAATDAFLPSEDFRTMVLFFDQYGLSHPVWAPEGDALVVTGRLRPDGISAAFGDIAGPFALRWRPEPGQPWEVLQPADTAVFATGPV